MLRSIKQLTGALLLLTLLSSTARLPEKKAKTYVSNYENVLGTSLEIKIMAGSPGQAVRAEKDVLAEIDRLNHLLSSYDPSSEFSQWMRAGKKPVTISPELFQVLLLFEQWRLMSHGALDASAASVIQVWKAAAKANRLPLPAEINQALQAVRQVHYTLDKQKGTALRTSDAPLVLNSFAKSYIMNKAAAKAMNRTGINGLVINIGGDILVRGAHTEQIGVSNPVADAENDPPVASMVVQNKTVATSGNYRRGEMIKGKWYSHIVDPRTGFPVSGVISATVVADSATDAGALATALNVLSLEEGRQLVASIPEAEYMLITADGRQIRSNGWKEIPVPAPKAGVEAAARVAGDKGWDPNFELAINLELARFEGMRTHRPFVAVWIEDEHKKPVRQIAVWYGKARWLNEMRSWHYAYFAGFSAGNPNIMSTTSTTRPAGKYTLKWDGKDDNGNLVDQGTYTIYLEAARQEGTHQLMSQEITLKKPQHIDIPGGVEIAAASLDYRKKANGN
ncbi:MAG: DUF2271 domain-containing protein [Williamsia sp.]|nr:DUF2271 domain-containing protein [Williamsia sp.]